MGQGNSDSKPAVINGLFTVLGAVLGALITGYFLLKSIDKSAEVQEIILATNTALVQEIQSGNSTQQSLFQTAAAPTSTALDPIIVTATLQPTARPTSTPSLPSFADDFENGIKPDWNIMFGNIGMANGAFTVIAPFDGNSSYHQAVLEGYVWQNARISISLLRLSHDSAYVCDFPCGLESAAGIILRYQPDGQSIGFFILANSRVMGLGTMNGNSEWNLITSTLVPRNGSTNVGIEDRQIVIDVIGNTYTVYMDNRKIASASIPGITEGQVGLWFYNSDSDQSPASYSPRYDDFSVQALP